MKNIIILFIILVFALIQSTVLYGLAIFKVRPDILLACVIILSIFRNWKWALFFALFAGLMKDIFTANSSSTNSFLFALWAILTVILSKKIPLDESRVLIGLVFVVSFLNSIVERLLLFYSGKTVLLGVFFKITFLESFYTAIVSIVAYKIFCHFNCLSLEQKSEFTF